MNGPIPASWAPYLLSVLRIIAAFSFMTHGTQKLFATPVAQPRDPAALLSLAGVAGALEVFGGLLRSLGFSRGQSPSCFRARWQRPISCDTRPAASFRSSMAVNRRCSFASSGFISLQRGQVPGVSMLVGGGVRVN